MSAHAQRRKPTLVANALANVVGRGWSTLLSVLAIPLYVHFMGIEAYGLIGVFTTLKMVFNFLTLGLSPTVNREMARYSAQPDQPDRTAEMRDMARTLELAFWTAGLVASLLLTALAPFIAHKWLTVETLPLASVQRALLLMGLLVFLQWPITFYTAGMRGLQDQVILSVVIAASEAVRVGGALLLLRFVSPTIMAFLLWQMAGTGLEVGALAVMFWRQLPKAGGAPRFRWPLLYSLRGFLSGMAGVTFLNVARNSADRVLLSHLLPLQIFGYYSLAVSLAQGVFMFVSPVQHALFPRFTEQVFKEKQAALTALYHRSSQLFTLSVMPGLAVLMCFPREVLLTWTGNAGIADQAGPVLVFLAFGVLMNCVALIPKHIQFAYGWTGWLLQTNAATVLLLIPALGLTAPRFGVAGAAAVRAAVFTFYTVLVVIGTHRRTLRDQWRQWLLADVGLPVLAGMAAALLCRSLPWAGAARGLMLLRLAACFLFVGLTGALCAPHARTLLNAGWQRWRYAHA